MIELDSKCVHISKNVRFFEEKSLDWSKLADSDASTYDPACDKSVTQSNELFNTSSPFDQNNEYSDISQQITDSHLNLSTSSTREDDEAPVMFRNLSKIYNSCSFSLLAADPITYDEASMDSNWHAAMNKEIESIQKNGTWKLTELQERKKAIVSKLVYESKLNPDRTLLRKKAFLIKVYSQ